MFTDNLQVLWYARPNTLGSYLAALIILVGPRFHLQRVAVLLELISFDINRYLFTIHPG